MVLLSTKKFDEELPANWKVLKFEALLGFKVPVLNEPTSLFNTNALKSRVLFEIRIPLTEIAPADSTNTEDEPSKDPMELL